MNKLVLGNIFMILCELQLKELTTIIVYSTVGSKQQDNNSNGRVSILCKFWTPP